MTKHNKRLSDLEASTRKTENGFLVVREHPDTGRLSELDPWLADPGRIYTEAEVAEMAARGWFVLRVKYVRNWRQAGESG